MRPSLMSLRISVTVGAIVFGSMPLVVAALCPDCKEALGLLALFLVAAASGGGYLAGRVATMLGILENRVAGQTIELEQCRQELAAANRDMESFAHSVSHDLHSPLRIIDGFSQAVLDEAGDKLDAPCREYLDRVRAACQRMGQLIDDILNLSRVIRAPLVRERVELSRLANTVASDLAGRDPQRAGQVTLVIAPDLWAVADERLMTIVLEHLLGNAWKFASKHATARIEFGATGVEYFVRDDGAGFDAAYAGKLFRAFQRLHGASEFPGSGIGLAAVQRIIQRHGGTVRAEGAVEHGATFYFTLGDGS